MDWQNTDLKPCTACQFQAVTASQHINHQKIHVGCFNFRFACPYYTCHFSYDEYASLSAHVSCHSKDRDEVQGERNGSNCCPSCDMALPSIKLLCQHLKKNHLEKNESLKCPLRPCALPDSVFTSSSQYGVHLCQYHPGWRYNFGNTANATEAINQMNSEELNQHASDDHQEGNQHMELDNQDSDDNDSEAISDSDDSDDDYYNDGLDYDQVVTYLANFYALLEGEHLVPVSTIDVIAKRLKFISEIMQGKIRKDLRRSMSAIGVSEENIANITQTVLSMDPLYNMHHSYGGVNLLTDHMRKKYFKENFKHVEPVEINLSINPDDRDHTVQYVDVNETLETLLSDPTVQKDVDKSFEIDHSNPDVVSDYTSGSVFQNSGTPSKRIDIFLFIDAFGCKTPLAPDSTKHKVNGAYMTLGNLKPFRRAFLRAIRLVLLVREKTLKVSDAMFKASFKRLIRDLKKLEKKGVNYKGEKLPVRLQFIIGDNLGQHTISGLIENFTGDYFCRYCDLPSELFAEDQESDQPLFRSGLWRTEESVKEDLRVKEEQNLNNHRGVKRKSPFAKLLHFKMFSDTRLPPCIAHDFFIGGIIDKDLSTILNQFVEQEKWFTYVELNARLKRFRYKESDQRNKPGQITTTHKLGGHAIQNWTVFRLIPIIIGDKIKTNHKLWQLYLLIKKIMELVCAPALSRGQISTMRDLICQYMVERRVLGHCVPKYHFMTHYPDLYEKCGPLIFLWSMAYEHHHQYFKRVSYICRNFINLLYSLASKYQISKAYQSMGPLFPTAPLLKDSSPLSIQRFEEDMKVLLESCNFSPNAVESEKLKFSDIKYRTGQWLLLHKGINQSMYAGQIRLLVCDGEKCWAVFSKVHAEYWKEYGLYRVTDEESTTPLVCMELEKMENPNPIAVYDFKGRDCFSLKHVFLDAD